MREELKAELNIEEKVPVAADPSRITNRVDDSILAANNSRQIMSAPTMVAAVAALALPLIKVKSAEALICTGDPTLQQEMGDPGDCADCNESAVPTDCSESPDGDGSNDGGGYVTHDWGS